MPSSAQAVIKLICFRLNDLEASFSLSYFTICSPAKLLMCKHFNLNLPICHSTCQYANLTNNLLTCLPNHKPTNLPTWLHDYLSTCQPADLPTCLPAILANCLLSYISSSKPANPPTCLPPYLPTCLPAEWPTC